jgi:hypothetical protein
MAMPKKIHPPRRPYCERHGSGEALLPMRG